MAVGLSFGQAREHVLSELGGEAVGDESRLELIMQAALVEISNRLAINREQRVTIPLSLSEGEASYILPGDCSQVLDVRISGRSIPQLPPQRDLDAEAPLSVNDWPSFWWVNQDPVPTLLFEPAPDASVTAYLEYVSVVDIDLYDLDESDERVWRMIPLPVEVHPAFVQYVLGRAMFKSDPGLGAGISNAALAEILDWRTQRARSRKKLLVLNSEASRRERTMEAFENDAARWRPMYD